MKKAFLWVLLLVCEGYMGQVHNEDIDLGTLARQSDYIVLARKAKPFSRIVKMPLDSTGKHKPYESRRYAYNVLEVLKTESDDNAKAGARISVRPAHDAMFFNLEQRYALEGVMKSPILKTYKDGSRAKEELETVILFLRGRDDKDGAYQIEAFGAFEAPDAKARVAAALGEAGTSDVKPEEAK
jgi:hypothetical protein